MFLFQCVYYFLCLINPRCACTVRVLVLGLSLRPFVGPSVCLSVCLLPKAAKKRYQWVQCHTGKLAILKKVLCSNMMVSKPSQEANNNYADEYGLPQPILSTVEAVEVTRRPSMWSWFAKNTIYQCSYLVCLLFSRSWYIAG